MEIKKEIQKAIILHQEGKLNDAKKIYEEILKINFDIAEVHHNLGILLKSLNKLEEAEKSFSKSISLKADFAISYYQLGNTKYKLKKFKESENCYEKAISLKSNFLEAYINLSKAQRELGKFNKAEENARISVKLSPNSSDANTQLGLILFDRGRLSDDLVSKDLDKLNEAKEILNKSINSNPNNFLAYLNYGLILQELGDLNKAKEYYQYSLKLEPNSLLTNYNFQILTNQIKLLEELGIDINKKNSNQFVYQKKFKKIPFISHRKPETELIDLLYKINSTELNKTKGGPLYGNGKTSDYNLLSNNNSILIKVKNDLIKIINSEIKSNVYFIDSFFNILNAGGGSVPHHHLNSFDKNFKLEYQKYSLTYYLTVGDQNCSEPGIFRLYEPNEEILPSNGMIMIIPSSRKHSAIYEGKKDRVMIGVNFYIY